MAAAAQPRLLPHRRQPGVDSGQSGRGTSPRLAGASARADSGQAPGRPHQGGWTLRRRHPGGGRPSAGDRWARHCRRTDGSGPGRRKSFCRRHLGGRGDESNQGGRHSRRLRGGFSPIARDLTRRTSKTRSRGVPARLRRVVAATLRARTSTAQAVSGGRRIVVRSRRSPKRPGHGCRQPRRSTYQTAFEKDAPNTRPLRIELSTNTQPAGR